VTEVSFTVNGTQVSVEVPPRLTLADVLREDLYLTGTRLGCEHGVCGACTVIVDGRAVRSCLTYCVQVDGADVLTVEGLGRPESLHPLQEAFQRHHALQCGFCTSGFLMSAYELLRQGADPDDSDLPQKLSGVLCRCTGYAGVVTAVREIASAYPDGVPAAQNLKKGVWQAPSRSGDTDGLRALQNDNAKGPASRLDLSMPEGEPTTVVSVETTISSPPDEAWSLLSDLERVSRCLPGVELTDELAPDTFAGRASLHLGPMGLDFAGAVRVAERDEPSRTLRAVAAGEDRSGSSVRAELRFSASPDGSQTAITATGRLFLTGKAAQFGRSIAGDVSRQLFEQFARTVDAELSGAKRAEPGDLGARSIAWRVIAARARQVWHSLLRTLGQRQ
jgi:xanthine dehydrogenase YagT iron-sulfur-binding subunit